VLRHAGQTVLEANSADLRAAWTNGPVNRLLGVGELATGEKVPFHHSTQD